MPQQPAHYIQNKTVPLEARIFPIVRKKAFPQKQQEEIIAFVTKKRIEIVRIAEISFVQAEDNYSRIHITNQLPVFLSRTLKEIESLLHDKGFIRTHQSFLVNPARVLNYDFSERTITLRDGVQIPVSRANSKKVSAELLNWGCR